MKTFKKVLLGTIALSLIVPLFFNPSISLGLLILYIFTSLIVGFFLAIIGDVKMEKERTEITISQTGMDEKEAALYRAMRGAEANKPIW